MAMILDGKIIAYAMKNILIERCIKLKENFNINPKINIVCLSNDGELSSSRKYLDTKTKQANDIGIAVNAFLCSSESSFETKLDFIKEISQKDDDGIFIEMPLKNLTKEQQFKIINTITDRRDIDCLSEKNKSKFYSSLKNNSRCPCTAEAILKLINYYDFDIAGTKVCIIGRSEIVGRPLAHLMLANDATVTICHSKTPITHIYDYIDNCDILITSAGKANLINEFAFGNIDWSNKTVIDVSFNNFEGNWCGDVTQSIKDRCCAYSPLFGGVGAITTLIALSRVVDNAEHRYEREMIYDE